MVAPNRWRNALAYGWPSIALLVVLLGAWEVLYRAGAIHQVLFPPPSAVAGALGSLLSSPEFYANYRITLFEILVGFVLGITVGFILGVLFTLLPRVRAVMYSYMVAFQALPKIVLAPLFVVWFGFGPSSKVAMALTICFFPVLVNTMLGFTLVDSDRLKVMRSLLATRWQILTKLRLPGALPTVFAGIKTALTLAIFGTIAAEFTGASVGVGPMVKNYNSLILVDYVLALVLTLVALGWIAYGLMNWIDRKLTFWAEAEAHGR